MTTSVSNYLAAKILNSVMHKNSFAKEEVWAALHTSSPGATGDPSTELVGASYERLHAISTKWSSPSNVTVAYQSALKFINLPPATVTHLALWTLQSGGNMLFFGALSPSLTVLSGGSITIHSNDLAVLLSA